LISFFATHFFQPLQHTATIDKLFHITQTLILHFFFNNTLQLTATHYNTLRFKAFDKLFHITQTLILHFFLNNTHFGPRFAAG